MPYGKTPTISLINSEADLLLRVTQVWLVLVVRTQVWENITRDYASECNVVFHADDFVCNYMICYYSETPRVYERVKSIARCKMMHSRY
jgi:hypothetical protein